MISSIAQHGQERADEVIRFIECLTLSGDFAGEPFILRPWQKQIIQQLFGTLREDGRRQYRECGIWLPRKNAKTEIAAAIACYFLLCVPQEGEIYTAAAEREQAGVLYSKVSGMVRRNPKLSARCKLIDSQKRIINRRTGTLFWSLSSDAKSKHGFNPSVLIGDEIHCWPKRDLWTALTTGSDTRSEPLFVTITTAGVWDPASLECELYEYATKVRDGIIEDPTYLPVIYAADEKDDWLDEDVWRRVNPALGDFRSLEKMQELAAKAQQIPRLENDFRRLYLNQHTQQTTRWIRMNDWVETAVDHVDFDPTKPVYMGLDLASTRDLTACAMVQKTKDGGYAAKWKFWLPRQRMREIEDNDRVPHTVWNRQGWIDSAGEQAIDYQVIETWIKEAAEQYNVQLIGFDPWNALQTANNLERSGRELVKISQGFAGLTGPSKELERVLSARCFVHEDNPVAEWCANNVEIQTDPGGNIRPKRPDSQQSRKKIDGIVALIMAIAVAMSAPERKPSSYATSGLMS